MNADHIIAAGSAFIDDAVGVNQEVIADVSPAQDVGVEVPDRADPAGITLVRMGAVGRFTLVEDHMGNWVIDRSATGVRRAPLASRDDAGPGRATIGMGDFS